MPQETINTNIVHLEGKVFSCKITSKDEQGVTADVRICTAKTVADKDKTKRENPLIHRIVVNATGEKASRLQEIEAAIKAAGEVKPNEMPSVKDVVAIDGKLAVKKNGQPFILVENDKISFPKKLMMKNSITLQGKVIETLSNIAYASATIELNNPAENGRKVRIPVCISSKDNPRKYAEMSQGKVKNGDVLAVKGPLISQKYSNGDREIFMCSVRIANYDNLSQKQTKTKKTQVGL